MTFKHISFPSIEQFRTVVKHVNDRCNYQNAVTKPTLRFAGTVKLHGTNASVVFNGTDFYAQSRENVIDVENDNAGFARFVSEHPGLKQAAFDVLEAFRTTGFMGSPDYEAERPHAKEAHTVAIYGEWCGGSIQKGVALNQLPKQFVIFGIKFLRAGKVIENGEEVDGQISTWLMPWDLKLAFDKHIAVWLPPEALVRCIEDFPTWQVDIDFNEPHLVQNKLAELTQAVEDECPFGKTFGVTGTGEGIVWTCIGGTGMVGIRTDDLVFKVKGEKHSVTKVKKLAAVDIEKVNSIKTCAELVGTPARFEQALDFLKRTNPGVDVLDNRYIGQFLKWINEDVAKEETDTITGNGLEVKEVTKAVGDLAKVWFKAQHLPQPAAAPDGIQR